jgi:molybdopterin-guanine dinucleotide biosynthesis protein A
VKTIVVSGARAKVGKTTLARQLCALLPGATAVKIGHGAEKPGADNILYHTATPFTTIARQHRQAAYLIIESNSILRECTPDLVVYLPADAPKPSAMLAREKADIVRGDPVSPDVLLRLSGRLGADAGLMRKIVWLSGARPSPVTAIILAGGESRRMGTDKARLQLNGKLAVEHLAHVLEPYFDDALVSVGADRAATFAGLKTVPDIRPGQGPLMGIVSALHASTTDVSFVIACDIPNVNLPLVFQLLSEAEGCEIAVPSLREGMFEPLFGVYAKRTAPAGEELLASGQRRIASLYGRCATKVVPVADASWYVNLNTPQEYDAYIGKRDGSRDRGATEGKVRAQ